jgi:type VI protein secretion system component Hcp
MIHMKRIALFCTLLLATARFSYAQQMYMKATTLKQGPFQASVAAPSSVGNGFMTVTAIDIGGKPIKVTKPTDANSPQFVEAAAEKLAFSTVVLKFANKDKNGAFSVYMTITLNGATISDLKQTNSTDVISFDYLKETVEQAPPPATPVVTPSTTIKPVAMPAIKKG